MEAFYRSPLKFCFVRQDIQDQGLDYKLASNRLNYSKQCFCPALQHVDTSSMAFGAMLFSEEVDIFPLPIQ